MPTFKYRARDKDGHLISATLQADNPSVAVALIREKQLFVISVKEASPIDKMNFPVFGRRFPEGELVFLTRQLSNLLSSGIPLSRALDLLIRHARSQRLKDVFGKVRDEVSGGGHFWEALGRHPQVFSGLYVSMIRAGETGADLDKVVLSLAGFMEGAKEVRERLISMLIYPIVLVCVGFGSIIFLMTFVMPKLIFLFEESGRAVPFLTRVLIAASSFMSTYWVWGLLLFIGGVFFARKFLMNEETKARAELFFLKAPFFGVLFQKIIFARLARILGLLLSNSVSILEALKVAQGVVENRVVARGLDEARAKVSQGGSLSSSLSESGVFSSVTMEMISIGEETGKLDDAFLKAADLYERESKEEIGRLLTLLEPALIFVLALGVAVLVLAMIQPILNISLEVS
jgi:type II secretory pathway component PulF